MASFHARTVDVNFVKRRGVGQPGDSRALEFERDVGIGRRRRAENNWCARSPRPSRAARARCDRRRCCRSQPRRARYASRNAATFSGVAGLSIRESRDEEIEQRPGEVRIQQQNALQRRGAPARDASGTPRRDMRAAERPRATTRPAVKSERVERVVGGKAVADGGDRVGNQSRRREISRTLFAVGPCTENACRYARVTLPSMRGMKFVRVFGQDAGCRSSAESASDRRASARRRGR